MDQQLFRRSTRNACDVRIHKEEFADDVALLASTREAAGIAVRVYMEIAKSFGLTFSFEKTKFMVVGYGVDEGDTLYHLTSLVAALTGLVSSPILGPS